MSTPKNTEKLPLMPPAAPFKVLPIETIIGQQAMHLGRMGITEPDDFDEGALLENSDLPPGFPSHHNGRELKYYMIPFEQIATHPKTTPGAHGGALATPVTRDVFPELPDARFNGQGFAQKGDCAICVGYLENFLRYKAVKMKRFDRLGKSFELAVTRDQDRSPTTGASVPGSVVTGTAARDPQFDPHLAGAVSKDWAA